MKLHIAIAVLLLAGLIAGCTAQKEAGNTAAPEEVQETGSEINEIESSVQELEEITQDLEADNVEEELKELEALELE